MLDIQITLSGPNWHQPICVNIYGYYLDCIALNSLPPFFFFLVDEDVLPDSCLEVYTPLPIDPSGKYEIR